MNNRYESFDVLLYLDVPYSEKDQAKALGARFDGEVKKWYYKGDARNLVKFHKWILKGKEETVIVENIFLLKNRRSCWRCQKDTTVIALGIGNYITIYYDDWDEKIKYSLNVSKGRHNIHVAWTGEESDIPPLLLNYLKKHYHVKTGYSKQAGKSFANHCEHCGAIQGNFHLFDEIDSPFFLYASTDAEMEKKVKYLEVFELPICFSMQLDWDIYLTDEDEDYECFLNNEIILTETDFDSTFKGMYNL